MATSKKEFRDIDLQGNEIQDLVIENLASDPSGSSSGRLYYNTTDSKLKFHNGTSFAEVGSGGSGVTVSSASFNTSNGVLTLTMSDASTVTVDLDNRYLQNANLFHGTNTDDQTPDTTATVYYPVFDNNAVTNTDIYSYVVPSSSTNTGIRLLKVGKYKVSYTLNWNNASYNNRINFFSRLVKHSSAITPNETEFPGTRSFGYARDNDLAKYATTTCVTVIDVAANEYIKCQATVAKNDSTFNDDFSGVQYHQNSSIVIEYLGDI